MLNRTTDYRLQTTAIMYFRFEQLESWQLAKKFANEIYKITKKFPKEEIFGLISQLRRAAVSICLNIAEGSDRKSDVEFKRFLRIGLTSLEEVITGLYISLDQNYINKEIFEYLYKQANELASKINALINKLQE